LSKKQKKCGLSYRKTTRYSGADEGTRTHMVAHRNLNYSQTQKTNRFIAISIKIRLFFGLFPRQSPQGLPLFCEKKCAKLVDKVRAACYNKITTTASPITV
jgi:hypothetical protein